MKKTVVKEALIYLPFKVLEGLIGIIMVAIFTRILTESSYGQYALVNTLSMTLFLPIAGWIMHAGYRHVLAYKEEKDIKDFNSTIWTLWLIMQGVFILLITLSCFLFPNFTDVLLYIPIIFIPYSATQILSSQMVAKKKIANVILLTAVNVTLKLILFLSIYRFMDPFFAVILAYASAEIISLLVVIVRTKGYFINSGIHINREMARNFFAYGIPLIGLAFTMSMTNFSDRFIIDYYFDKSLVAKYQGNYTLASATFTFIMVGIMRAVNPNILKAWHGGSENVWKDIWSGFRFFLLLAIPAAVGIAVLSKEVSRVVLASSYNEASIVIAWVAFGMLLLGSSEYLIKPLELNKNTKPIFYSSLIACIINIVLNIIFIKTQGYIFAAVTTLISYFVYIFMIVIIVRKRYYIIIEFASIIKILLSSVLMGVVIWYAKQFFSGWLNILLMTVLGVITYSLMLLASGEIKSEVDYLIKRLNLGGKN